MGPTFLFDLEVGLEGQKVGNHCVTLTATEFVNAAFCDERETQRAGFTRELFTALKTAQYINFFSAHINS